MKAITQAARVLVLALCVWVAVSYGEIVTHNTQPQPNYSNYNMFNIMQQEVI